MQRVEKPLVKRANHTWSGLQLKKKYGLDRSPVKYSIFRNMTVNSILQSSILWCLIGYKNVKLECFTKLHYYYLKKLDYRELPFSIDLFL